MAEKTPEKERKGTTVPSFLVHWILLLAGIGLVAIAGLGLDLIPDPSIEQLGRILLTGMLGTGMATAALYVLCR